MILIKIYFLKKVNIVKTSNLDVKIEVTALLV